MSGGFSNRPLKPAASAGGGFIAGAVPQFRNAAPIGDFLETAPPNPRVFAFLFGLLAAAAFAYLIMLAMQMSGHTPRLGSTAEQQPSMADSLSPLDAFVHMAPKGWSATRIEGAPHGAVIFDVPVGTTGDVGSAAHVLVTVKPETGGLSQLEMARTLYSRSFPGRAAAPKDAPGERIFVFEGNEGQKYFARCAAPGEASVLPERNCLAAIVMPGGHEALIQFSEHLADEWPAILGGLEPLTRHLNHAGSGGDHSKS